MQILTINNRNFKKPSRNPSNRTKVKILGKFFWIAHQNIWFRGCSVTAKMFKNLNSGKNLRKRNEILLKIDQGHIRF